MREYKVMERDGRFYLGMMVTRLKKTGLFSPSKPVTSFEPLSIYRLPIGDHEDRSIPPPLLPPFDSFELAKEWYEMAFKNQNKPVKYYDL